MKAEVSISIEVEDDGSFKIKNVYKYGNSYQSYCFEGELLGDEETSIFNDSLKNEVEKVILSKQKYCKSFLFRK